MEFLQIDKQEVLRYLGHNNQEIDQKMNQLLDECIDECHRAAVPRFCYRVFDCMPIQEGISVLNTSLVLKGKSIYDHLQTAHKCAIMAATLGAPFDNLIRIAQSQSMTRALVLDACGTEYIEKVCNSVEAKIKQQAADESFYTNFRFSPGYGDLPLEQQPQITGLLDTSRKIGLTCTKSLIMLPRKSVTAIIGFLKQQPVKQQQSACEICKLAEHCALRKEGKFCGR